MFEKNGYSEWSSVVLINSIGQALQLLLKYWMNVKPEIRSFIIVDIFLSKSLFTFLVVYSIFLHSKMVSDYGYRLHWPKLVEFGDCHQRKFPVSFKESCSNRWKPSQAEQQDSFTQGNLHFPLPSCGTGKEAVIVLLSQGHLSSCLASSLPHVLWCCCQRGTLRPPQQGSCSLPKRVPHQNGRGRGSSGSLCPLGQVEDAGSIEGAIDTARNKQKTLFQLWAVLLEAVSVQK